MEGATVKPAVGTSPSRPRAGLRAVVVLASAVVLAAGGTILADSPLTQLADVQVVGTSRLDAAAVREAAGVDVGAPLHRIDPGQAVNDIGELAPVAGVTVSFPNPVTFRIDITEHAGAYRVVSATDAGEVVITADGLVIADELTDGDRDLPELTVSGPLPPPGTPLGTAGAAAVRVHEVIPASLRPAIRRLHAVQPDRVHLTLRSGAVVDVGDTSDIGRKLRVAEMVLTDLQARGETATRIDVRAPDHPAVRSRPH